jgi:hypothetical protein
MHWGSANTVRTAWAFVLLTCAWCSAQTLSGRYVGTGMGGRSITGLGFSPLAVMVQADTAEPPYIRTTTMPGIQSKRLSSGSWAMDRVTGFLGDGFSVGLADNALGTTYSWVAWRSVPGVNAAGTYVGDGSDNRSISGVGFRPGLTFVFSQAVALSVHRFASMPPDSTFDFSANLLGISDLIQAEEANGFQVGTAAEVNLPATIFHHLAWVDDGLWVELGTYVGNGTTGRQIPTRSAPESVFLKSGGTAIGDGLAYRSTSHGSGVSMTGAASLGTAEEIQGLTPVGFQVGRGARVNANGVTYHYVAFGSASADGGTVDAGGLDSGSTFDGGPRVMPDGGTPDTDAGLEGANDGGAQATRREAARFGVGCGCGSRDLGGLVLLLLWSRPRRTATRLVWRS